MNTQYESMPVQPILDDCPQAKADPEAMVFEKCLELLGQLSPNQQNHVILKIVDIVKNNRVATASRLQNELNTIKQSSEVLSKEMRQLLESGAPQR